MATDPFLTKKSVLGLAERVRLAPPPTIFDLRPIMLLNYVNDTWKSISISLTNPNELYAAELFTDLNTIDAPVPLGIIACVIYDGHSNSEDCLINTMFWNWVMSGTFHSKYATGIGFISMDISLKSDNKTPSLLNVNYRKDT